jgi:hypothetical protein
VTALDEAARASIGYVPQKSELFEWLTPLQLLDYFKALYPRWNQAKVDGLMQRWNLAGDTAISKLASFPAAKSSACPSSARWRTIQNCWCWTNRSPA